MHAHMSSQTPYQPAGGYDPAPKRRRVGLLVAVSALVALLVVAGGLALFGPFRATSAASASDAAGGPVASSRSAQSPATGAGTAGQVTTTVADAPTTVPVPTPVIPATPAPVQPVVTGGGSSGGGAPAPQAPSAPAPQAPSAPAPVITSFVTPEDIDCHNGDFQTFSASWTTTNATKTVISIDGAGAYKTYAANDSDSLPFNCSSPHTFLLTAYGQDGSSVSRTITLQPRNVQQPPAPDTDDDI